MTKVAFTFGVMVKLVVCSQVKEIKARFHIMRCISETVSSFRSQCYMSENSQEVLSSYVKAWLGNMDETISPKMD